MGWATAHIETLKRGETTRFRPRGRSMEPRVRDGELCTVRPLREHEVPQPGTVVLCRVRDAEYLHLVKEHRWKSTEPVSETEYLIGNNRGGTNGWIRRTAIFGVLERVDA